MPSFYCECVIFFRIPTEQDLQPMEVFPKNIDYEKGIIVYNISLNKHTADEGKIPQASHSYGFGDFYSGVLNIVCNLKKKLLCVIFILFLV